MARKIRQQICANCNHSFNAGENFCPNCGQENHSPNQPIKHYTSELIESLLHLDSKIFVTIGTLFRYPGKISREYNDNKRARYTPPVRLYIFISLIFFVLVQFSPDDVSIQEKESISNIETGDTIPKIKNWKIRAVDSTTNDSNYIVSLFGIHLTIGKEELPIYLNAKPHQIDSLILASKLQPNYFTRTLFKQIIRSFKADENFKELLKAKFIKFSSFSFFLLMPFFALLISIAYFRRKKNYYEYLIFSIHYHTVVFLFLSLIILINIFIDIPAWVYFLISIGLLYYMGKALRNNYQGSRFRTILKMIFICTFYWITSLFIALFVVLLGWWFV